MAQRTGLLNRLRVDLFQKLKEVDDVGFGSNPQEQSRSINSDGSFNVKRINNDPFDIGAIYHALITMKWWMFNALVIIYFTVINLVFTMGYMIIGADGIRGIEHTDEVGKFFETFFFSIQTLSTVGFGYLSPQSWGVQTLAAIESLVGFMGFALITGLLYGRFSRPTAKIRFSKNVLISPYKEGLGLMFKIANARRNELVEVQVEVTLAINVVEDNKEIRRFYSLELERKFVNFFPLTWTIVHPLNEKSPIKTISKDVMREAKAELLIYIKAMDDTYAQSVHARYSYLPDDVVVNARFINIIQQKHETNLVDLDLLNRHEVLG
jgi:inward rectifier potassium channel